MKQIFTMQHSQKAIVYVYSDSTENWLSSNWIFPFLEANVHLTSPLTRGQSPRLKMCQRSHCMGIPKNSHHRNSVFNDDVWIQSLDIFFIVNFIMDIRKTQHCFQTLTFSLIYFYVIFELDFLFNIGTFIIFNILHIATMNLICIY
jgi:hypothetical protein